MSELLPISFHARCCVWIWVRSKIYLKIQEKQKDCKQPDYVVFAAHLKQLNCWSSSWQVQNEFYMKKFLVDLVGSPSGVESCWAKICWLRCSGDPPLRSVSAPLTESLKVKELLFLASGQGGCSLLFLSCRASAQRSVVFCIKMLLFSSYANYKRCKLYGPKKLFQSTS